MKNPENVKAKTRFRVLFAGFLMCVLGSSLVAKPEALIFAFKSESLEEFERNAAVAQELGATHMMISNNLPLATWQMDPPGDPYPAWYIHQIDFLKIFPPPELRPYVNLDHAREVAEILEARCRILRKYGLKALWNSNFPQVLPEAFFVENPHLRGPRVDQPNRSRTARFSICMDREESLRLYRESLQMFLQACPEVDTMDFLTTDSGSGFCWVPGLYPGGNGPAWCEHRSMADRVVGALENLQDGARELGLNLSINVNQIGPRQWMRPSFPEPMEIVRKLPPGLGLNGLEGPEGRKFMDSEGPSGWQSSFSPVVGIFLPEIRSRSSLHEAPRRMVRFGGPSVQDTYVRFHRMQRSLAPGSSILDQYTLLRRFAVEAVGEELADDLLELWTRLLDVEKRLDTLNFGSVLFMGGVLNRWINRPMIPFPDELPAETKRYYSNYLFQAKGEAQANNLIDIQAMRMFEGWGAKMLVQRVMETTIPDVEQARDIAKKVSEQVGDPEKKKEWLTLAHRLEALECLLRTADNMVAYQAYLDRVKGRGLSPDPNPPLGEERTWERRDIMRIARNEIDNMVRLRSILLASEERIIATAASPEEENIMNLSPDIAAQLKMKIDIMNEHWVDYDRLYTVPNP